MDNATQTRTVTPQPLRSSIQAIWHRVVASDFARKVLSMYATQIASIVLQMATTILVARVLGPTGRGRYAVAVAIGMLAARFITLGLHSSNTYFVAKRRELLPEMLGNTLLYSLAIGSAAGVAIWGAFHFVPSVAPLRGKLLLLSLVWIPLGLGYLLMQNLLVGIKEIHAYNKIELAGKILVLALVTVAVLTHHGTAEAVFSVMLVVLVFTCGLAFRHLRQVMNGSLRISATLARESLGVGFRAYLVSLFGFMVLRIDLLMVQKIQGPYHSGNYSVAWAIFLRWRFTGKTSRTWTWHSSDCWTQLLQVSGYSCCCPRLPQLR